MTRTQDIFLGLLFTGIGLAAAWLARSYSGASGTYPLVLGLFLALFGTLIFLRATRADKAARRVLVDAPAKMITALAACIAYTALIVPLGFYTASILLMIALPLALGFRRPVYTLIVGLIFIGMVWLVFSTVLGKPLPAEFWSAARLGGH